MLRLVAEFADGNPIPAPIPKRRYKNIMSTGVTANHSMHYVPIEALDGDEGSNTIPLDVFLGDI